MGAKTGIEWTDSTWNPVAAFLREDLTVQVGPKTRVIPKGTRGWFCTKVSPGCAHCYAEGINVRLGNGLQFIPCNLDKIEWHLVGLDDPLKWKRPRMIFTDSMDDFFHEAKPDRLIDRVFAVIALAGHHAFQVLTKRSKRAREYLSDPRTPLRIAAVLAVDYAPTRKIIPQLGKLVDDLESGAGWPLPHVAIGASVENQPFADERISELLRTPAAIRFLSCEPLLGYVDLNKACRGDWQTANDCALLDWIICGGESGREARPMHPEWARLLRDQCITAGVPFHFKQWGEWVPYNQGDAYLERFDEAKIVFPAGEKKDGWPVYRVGKKRAGRTLDGRTWDELPAAWIDKFQKAA